MRAVLFHLVTVVLVWLHTAVLCTGARLCGTDFTTEGLCYMAVNTPKTWHDAKKHCKEQLPQPGSLVAIYSQEEQELVAQEVDRLGWDRTWINGCLKGRIWYFQRYGTIIAYQGCWKDNADRPDLDVALDLAPGEKPSDCIDKCGRTIAGVQLDSTGKLLCRCGGWFGTYGKSFDPLCDTPCPGSGPGDDVIDQKCGAQGHQLIFYRRGKRFHNFVDTYPPHFGACAAFNHSVGYKWTPHNCRDKLPFICQYTYFDQAACEEHSVMWISGMCISIHADPKDFYEASAFCSLKGGMLLKVDKADINNAIVELLQETSLSYNIALTDFEWIFELNDRHEEMFKYFNWGSGQPVSTKKYDCFEMKSSDGHRWHNVDCQTPLPFVCMVDVKALRNPGSSTPPGNLSVGSIVTTEEATLSASGISSELVIGLVSGAGVIILTILAGVLVCFVVRYKQQKRQRNQKSMDGRQNRQKHPPESNKYKGNDLPLPDRSNRGRQDYEELGNRNMAFHTYDKIHTKDSSGSVRNNKVSAIDKEPGDVYDYIEVVDEPKTDL